VSLGRNRADLLTFINPAFIERDGMQLEEEGCLSVPGFNATVARPSRAILKGLDREGQEQTVEGTGLLARCFQHEMDHLDGTLFVDRLRGLQKDLIVRKIRKLSRAGKW
jgi:peptide deformylase